jgi:serine/threonine protein phosphatase PrpC
VDVSGQVALRCPACEAPLLADDRFCEACGAAVATVAAEPGGACRACGAPATARGPDGYCTVCGIRELPGARRMQLDLIGAAAVTEQGRTHRRNEDAFCLEVVAAGVVAVVCDGISTAASGDAAARAAADTAAAALSRPLNEGADLRTATAAAVLAAHEAVHRVPATTTNALALPSCTLVSAACRDGEVVVGWVGDSRAYWLAPGDARQLTVDDSWATEQVADGLMSAEEALADRRAHAITRWVGADAPPEAPQLTVLAPPSSGRLVLCTDGLWNEAPTPDDIASLIAELEPDATPAAIAHHLVDAAMSRGARDDVTVAVIDIRPPGGREP